MIAIVDFGMGNLRNVHRACGEIGAECVVTADAAAVRDASKVILPGVGAFGEAVKRIDMLGLREPIMQHVSEGKPLLGICLGMQLLYEESEESPGASGLGLLSGNVKKFGDDVKVPHIGWNDVHPVGVSRLFDRDGGIFYFVHSFYAAIGPETIARAEYGIPFSAAVGKGDVLGVQFHPEKSQAVGLALLKRFAAIPIDGDR